MSGFVVAWNTTCHVALGCAAAFDRTSARATRPPRHCEASGARSTENTADFWSYVAADDKWQFAAGGFAVDPRTGLKRVVTGQASRVAWSGIRLPSAAAASTGSVSVAPTRSRRTDGTARAR